MFQRNGFVCRFEYRVAIISVALLAFAQSSLHAQAFATSINVSGDNSNAAAPRMAVDSHGNVDVVWLDDSAGTPAVFFSRSSDRGQTFSAPLNISNHTGSPAESERIAVDPTGNIYVVWSENSAGAHTIFFTRSTDDGMSFSAPQKVSENSMAMDPSIAIDSGGGVNLLWTDKGQGQRTVFFSRSTDQALTFSMPMPLSSAEVTTGSPQLIADSTGNYVIWTQPNTGSTESVLFRRDTIRPLATHSNLSVSSVASLTVAAASLQRRSERTVVTAKTSCNIYEARTHSREAGTENCHSSSRETSDPASDPTVPYSVSSTQYVDCVHYSCSPDIGLGINTACSALPGSGGTIVITHGAAVERLSTTISCGNASKPVTFIFDPSTVIQPASPTTNIFQLSENNTVQGLHIDTTNEQSYAGNALFNNESQGIDNLTLTNITVKNGTGSLASCLHFATTGSTVSWVEFAEIQNFTCTAGTGATAVIFLVSKDGFINANHISGPKIFQAKFGIQVALAASATGQFNGNTLVNYEYEALSLSTALAGIDFSSPGPGATGNVSRNTVSMNAYDLSGGHSVTIDGGTSLICANLFQGELDPYLDASSGCNIPNQFNDLTTGTYNGLPSLSSQSLSVTGGSGGSLTLADNTGLRWTDSSGVAHQHVLLGNDNVLYFIGHPTTQV